MLSFGNKEFRNLQEQVLKNMRDIQDIEQGATILADFGIKVVGQVDSINDLPNPAEYKGEYGDAYLVGTEKPYNYYIFTRAFEGQEEPSWFDLGEFPVPGPQGAQGPQGETGATPVITGAATISTLQPGQAATVSITKSGTNANPTLTFAFAVPQGAQGIQGLTGPQGPQGIQGPKGDKGDKGEQGGLIDIVGIVATADLLPAPSTLQKLDAAYLVGASPDYELYVQVGETPSTALWTNLGAVNEGTVVSVNGTPQTVWEANTKVSVSDGYLVNTLYGQAAGTGNGQTHVPYGSAVVANNIVQRDINGQVLVPETPTANNMAASKAYVDANAGGTSPIQYQGDLIIGDSNGNEARLAIGSAGQVLAVNSTGTSEEWKTINGTPAIASGDAGKVLKVNNSETGTEWGDASGSIIKDLSNSTNTGTGSAVYSSGALLNPSSTLLDSISVSTLTNSLIMNPGLAISSANTLLKNNSTIEGIIALGNVQNNTSNKAATLKNSIFAAGSLTSTYSYITPPTNMTGSILFGSQIYDTAPANACNYEGILAGGNDIHFISYGDTPTKGILMVGYGLALSPWYFNFNNTSHRAFGIGIVGSYNKMDSTVANARFIVGCGNSENDRANCFEAGKDASNNKYIVIGATKLTETQLQALLATL